MDSLKYNVIFFLTLLMIATSDLDISKDFKANDDVCKKLAQRPDFRIENVIGKRWRVYYAWNLNKKASDKCMEISFKNATNSIVNRIWNDMYEYLERQPPWSDASLLMSMTPRHEMLLFSDGILPGKFIGVANIVRSESIPSNKKNSVPLFVIHMKLFRGGRYLVISDCNIGISTLSTRNDEIPYHVIVEIEGLATTLPFGQGSFICLVKNKVQDFTEGEIVVQGLK